MRSSGDGVPEVAGAAAPDAVAVDARWLLAEHDAVVLACGSTLPRDVPIKGRELSGVHFAMEYLKPSNLFCEGSLETPAIDAAGKRVVIIGGGDTGADCLGTAHRQGAVEVHQLEIMPSPPAARAPDNPWPTWPLVVRTSSAHEEGGERRFGVSAGELVGDEGGAVRALRGVEVRPAPGSAAGFEAVEGTAFELPCELVLLAAGFAGPEREGVVAALDLELDGRGNVGRDRVLHDEPDRCLRLRGHGQGAEPDRVGDRRGSFRRCIR